MRELFEDMNERNTRMRHPSPLLTIDDTLYPYCGHIGFKQYNPNKPAKYGLLYLSFRDSSIPYTYYSLTYEGKPEKVEDPACKVLHHRGQQVFQISHQRAVYCNLKGINIPMDHYFTSVSLATWALGKNITIVGTMKHDRKDIPNELKPVADREERPVIYVYNTKEKIMLVSYIDKKKSGKKNVIVLSTMHDNVKIVQKEASMLSIFCQQHIQHELNLQGAP